MQHIAKYFHQALLLVLAWALPWGHLVLAQTKPNQGSPKSADSLLYDVLKPSLRVVRQEYILKDSAGEEYGYKNSQYFGRTYQVGLVTAGKLWVGLDHAQKPWENDGRFIDNKTAIGPKKPQFFSYALSQLDTLVFDPVKTSTWDSLENFGCQAMPGDALGQSDNVTNGGWLLLIYTKAKIDPDNPKFVLDYRFLKLTKTDLDINTDNKSKFRAIPPDMTGFTILGGAFYTTQKKGQGTIQFQVAGLMAMHKDKKQYRICLLPSDSSEVIRKLPKVIMGNGIDGHVQPGAGQNLPGTEPEKSKPDPGSETSTPATKDKTNKKDQKKMTKDNKKAEKEVAKKDKGVPKTQKKIDPPGLPQH